MFHRSRTLARSRLSYGLQQAHRFCPKSCAQDFYSYANGSSSQLRHSFCSDTHALEIGSPDESPEIPDWIQDAGDGSCSSKQKDDDFIPPSISYWIGNHKNQDGCFDMKGKGHEIIESDVDKLCRILKNRFESPDLVVNALDSCDASVSHSLVDQVLRRFSYDWISAYGFFKWAQFRRGFVHSPESFNLMVDNLGKTRKFDIMWRLVEEMKFLEGYVSLDTMTKIMRRLAKAGKYEDAIKAFKNMQLLGVNHDIIALNRLMDALVKQGSVENAESVLLEFKDRIPPTLQSYNVLVHGWCKSRQLGKATKTVDVMKNLGMCPTSVTYTCFIEAYCHEKDFREVSATLEEMKKNGCRPSVVTYTIMMNALAKAKETDKALEIYEKMKADNCSPDASFYDALINALSKSGRLKDSEAVFDDMAKQGVTPVVSTYNTLIFIAAQNLQEEKALSLLKKIEESGCKPDSNTYVPLLKMCCRLGRMKVLRFLLSHMFNNHIALDLGLYSLLVSRLCRNGKLGVACFFFEELVLKGFAPMDCTYVTLVQRLEKKGMHKEKQRVEEMMSRVKQPGPDLSLSLPQKL